MPLPMVHFAVAELLIPVLKIKDTGSFYLGAIAPDAVHMRSQYKPEYKLASHLRESAEAPKEIILNAALNMVKTADGRAFAMGYGVHVASDMIWNRTVFSAFKQKYQAAGLPPEEQKNVYYNDTDRLDFELFRTVPWREAVWADLSGCTSAGYEELVSAGEVEAWKQRTLHWYDSGESRHRNPVRFLTCGDLLGFAEQAADEISASLK